MSSRSCGLGLQVDGRARSACACASAGIACSEGARQRDRGQGKAGAGRRVGFKCIGDGRAGGATRVAPQVAFVESIIHERSLVSPAPATAPARRWPGPTPSAKRAFHHWLAGGRGRARPATPPRVRPASADASFRRYLRVDGGAGQPASSWTRRPTRRTAGPSSRSPQLMAEAGLNVPRVLAWDEPQGFMLLDDLGTPDHDRGGRRRSTRRPTSRCTCAPSTR